MAAAVMDRRHLPPAVQQYSIYGRFAHSLPQLIYPPHEHVSYMCSLSQGADV